MKKRILVCGGRNFNDRAGLYGVLAKLSPGTIISGMAPGADSLAAQYACDMNIDLLPFHAEWKLHGNRAGYIRNVRMLAEGKPELVVAFPGGTGTAMMIDLAKRAGVHVLEISGMGTKGSANYNFNFSDTYGYSYDPYADTDMDDNAASSFATDRFADLYKSRLAEFPKANHMGRKQILIDTMAEEHQWLNDMGREYEEIMQVQEEIDKLQP